MIPLVSGGRDRHVRGDVIGERGEGMMMRECVRGDVIDMQGGT